MHMDPIRKRCNGVKGRVSYTAFGAMNKVCLILATLVSGMNVRIRMRSSSDVILERRAADSRLRPSTLKRTKHDGVQTSGFVIR